VAWKDDNNMPTTEKKCHAIMDILTRGLMGPTRIISQVYKYKYTMRGIILKIFRAKIIVLGYESESANK
jgi:hypothetical protein